MDAMDLARQVAADLAKEYGSEVERETARAIQGKPAPRPQAVRSMAGEVFTRAAEIAAIADLIVSVAPRALERWARLRDKDSAKADIVKSVTPPPGLSADTTERVLATMIDKVSQSG
ncbi:MAG: hypothetical protein ACHQAY_00675 [Hyphomicrobiales bacterium]